MTQHLPSRHDKAKQADRGCMHVPACRACADVTHGLPIGNKHLGHDCRTVKACSPQLHGPCFQQRLAAGSVQVCTEAAGGCWSMAAVRAWACSRPCSSMMGARWANK